MRPAQQIQPPDEAGSLLHMQRDLTLTLETAGDLPQAFRGILDALLRVKGLDCGGIYLREARTGRIVLAAHQGLTPAFVRQTSVYAARSRISRLVMGGKPVYLDEPLHFLAAVRAEGLRSVASIPVRYEGRILGALNLGSHSLPAIPPATRHALETVASQVGHVIGRTKIQGELQEQRRNLQSLFNTLNDFLFVCDRRGRILETNPVVRRRLGFSTAELRRMTIPELHPPGQRRQARKILQDISAGRTRECDLPLRRKDGVLIAVETRVCSGRWGEQEVLFGISRDMTRRHRTEEKLRRYSERLEIMNAVDRAILSVRSPVDIAGAVIEHVSKILPARALTIRMVVAGEKKPVTLATLLRSGTVWNRQAPSSGSEVSLESLGRRRYVLCANMARQRTGPASRVHRRHPWLQSYLAIPLKAEGRLIGCFELEADHSAAFNREHIQTACEIGDHLAVALRQAELFQSVSEQREHLRALTRNLTDAREAERRELSRELHDLVGQNLTVLAINLNLIRGQLPPGDSGTRLAARIDDSLVRVEETVSFIRGAMAELRPPVLDDYGLLAALRWYAGEFSTRTGIDTTVYGREGRRRLPVAAELAVFRIVQEALSNIAKHARAKNVTVTVASVRGRLRLVVADDGIGFSVPGSRRVSARGGWGLSSMRERAEAAGGRLHIESRRGAGSRIVFEME